MIHLHKLTKQDVGRRVIYTDDSGTIKEEGVITSWNRFYIFVRFKGLEGEACLPHNLDFIYNGVSHV